MMGTIIDFEDYMDANALAGGSQGLDTWINFEGETLATLQGISKIYVSDQNSTPLLPT